MYPNSKGDGFYLEFIKRTKKIVEEYTGNKDVTLLVNCCLGLVAINRQTWEKEIPSEEVINWHIHPTICKAKDQKADDYSLKNAVIHLRNSIVHARFKFEKGASRNIETIIFWDNKGGSSKDNNFELTISASAFKDFLMKFAKTMIEKLEVQNL